MNKKHKFGVGIVIFLLIFLLFEIVFDEKGVIDLFELKERIHTIEQTNKKLIKENIKLTHIIERLKNDQKYVESVARKDLGMISKDEIILKFKNRAENKKKQVKDE